MLDLVLKADFFFFFFLLLFCAQSLRLSVNTIIYYVCIYQNFMLSARSEFSVPSPLSLRLTVGFVCILSFGSFSSCKVHSFMIVFNLRLFFGSFLPSFQCELCPVFACEGMETWCFCLLENNCWSVFDVLCFIVVCLCLLPAEMSSWSQLLVQCATYWKLRGKVHVHVLNVCLFVQLHASCFRAMTLKCVQEIVGGV